MNYTDMTVLFLFGSTFVLLLESIVLTVRIHTMETDNIRLTKEVKRLKRLLKETYGAN